MPSLTPERKAEIREWLTTPRFAVQPPLGYEIDALLDEVDALVADNERLNEALSQTQARAEHAELRLAEQLAEGRYPGES